MRASVESEEKEWENRRVFWNMNGKRDRCQLRAKELKISETSTGTLSEEQQRLQGARCDGMWRALLSGGSDDRRHGIRLSAA